MDFKYFIFRNYAKTSYLILGTLLAILLLVIRIKLTHSFFLLFMGWNLILAFIPLGIALFVYKYPTLMANAFYRWSFAFTWLLFFPNAPYVLTDFIHLQLSSPSLLLLDLVLLLVYALLALTMGLYSLQLMQYFYCLFYSAKTVRILLFLSCFLSGYGVYLGRVVRLNSWNVLTAPWTTLLDILQNIASPTACLFTLTFGSLLVLGHKYLLKKHPLKL